MSCPTCNNNLLDGKYICHTNDYRIIDLQGNLIFVFKGHDLPPDDIEINDVHNCNYCNQTNCKYFVFNFEQ